jgi:hypothetical protein
LPLNEKLSLKLFKILILWILALQLLNMSICSEAYWFYYNENLADTHLGVKADPTETIVEWLVEMKYGQLDAFSYDHHNIDAKTNTKMIAFQIDLQNEKISMHFIKQSSKVCYAHIISNTETNYRDIFSPPPEQDHFFQNNII